MHARSNRFNATVRTIEATMLIRQPDVRILGGMYDSRSRQGAPKTGVLPVGGTSGLRRLHAGIGAREAVPEPTPSCHANVIVMR